MRLLRRNTVKFTYRKNLGEQEIMADGMHTGTYGITWSEPVEYRGCISLPNGLASDNLFGINTDYTHVLLMDRPKADIAEDGVVEWNGETYDVKAVRRSLNFLSAALRQRTRNHVVTVVTDG